MEIWTGKRGYHTYLCHSVTVHFLYGVNALRRFILACPRFIGSHTGERVLELTIEMIEL